MSVAYKRMNNLPAFKIQILAQISDWLDEQGELCIVVRLTYGSTLYYLIRSIYDLRVIVLQESRWNRVGFSILPKKQLPLRGVANQELLEQAIQQFPDGHSFYVAQLAYCPEQLTQVSHGEGHAALLRAFAQVWGNHVAVGAPPPFWRDDTLLVIAHPQRASSEYKAYAPYDADPARYQWIVDMWRE